MALENEGKQVSGFARNELFCWAFPFVCFNVIRNNIKSLEEFVCFPFLIAPAFHSFSVVDTHCCEQEGATIKFDLLLSRPRRFPLLSTHLEMLKYSAFFSSFEETKTFICLCVRKFVIILLSIAFSLLSKDDGGRKLICSNRLYFVRRNSMLSTIKSKFLFYYPFLKLPCNEWIIQRCLLFDKQEGFDETLRGYLMSFLLSWFSAAIKANPSNVKKNITSVSSAEIKSEFLGIIVEAILSRINVKKRPT